ncbi:MAG: helix-turn-helix domain-containing protein [Crocinitomicaceae bacterium]|nr:helix-turn-helix domain-containing protein [Crocinitomicaceae bacterium]
MTKVLRKKNKLSRQQLADLLDVSRMTIQNLEAGKNCTLDTLLKVLQHFDEMETFYLHFEERREQLKQKRSLY